MRTLGAHIPRIGDVGRDIAATTLVGVALLAAACGGADRTLLVHSSLPDAVNAHAERAFEQAHPGVDVRFVTASPDETLERLRSGDPPPIDVWWGAPADVLVRAAGEDLLSGYVPSWTEESGLVDPDEERWHPSLVSPFVIAFNRDSLSVGLAPRDWVDMFHFRFRGEVVLLDPATSPETAHFLGSMLVEQLREGRSLLSAFDWLMRLDASVAEYPREPADVLRRLRFGDALVTVLPRHLVEDARHDGAPWIHYRFPEGGTPVLARGIAIPARAAEPELARRFVDLTGTPDVVAVAVRHTRWAPAPGALGARPPRGATAASGAGGASESGNLPPGFQLELPWAPRPLAADTLAAELDGWLQRWQAEVRGRGRGLF